MSFALTRATLKPPAARKRAAAQPEAVGFRAMPIHVRANPGDYAEACLLPGDPLRAKYIAETFLEDVVQRNAERGLLGYTGTFNGNAGLGAGERHGLPVGRDRDRGARASSA